MSTTGTAASYEVKAARTFCRFVTDTRMVGHDGKRIPDSGNVEQCQHCGRDIQVHAMIADYEYRVPAGTEYGRWVRAGNDRIIGKECCKKLHIERLHG